MKKSIFLLSVILLGIIVTTLYNCTKDSKETCSQDEICAAKFVTSCCTDTTDCVYKYNGKEYKENQIGQLEIDLGCGTSGIVLKSAGKADELSEVIIRLKALMAKVKEQTKAFN